MSGARTTKRPTPPNLIEAEAPGGGRLFAAVDPTSRYVTPKVCETRFSATLHPFASEAEARAALKRAGAVLT